ncbi:lipopolysaccharide biosynthesis protein [Butyrivibrio sp. VCB2006]|uniref:lipopolysaccharide biosynthesis protein n=1 Tax=Butyrivibrio sp. VCB2006 TaxID=1280679 RepID=UPI0004068F81|nr:oligosaccharide flippase family protein [Butyrivibrio sp. VCB2006]
MSDSRAKRSAQNAATGFVYHFSGMLLSFIRRTVFIHTLGNEYLGLNGIFSDVLNLLSMADLGFSTAMAYSFYKPLAEKDEEKIASLIAFYKRIYNVIALVVLCLGLCCVPFLRLIINTERDIPYLEVYYLFSLANTVMSYLFVYKTTLLTADQKDYKVVRIRNITQWIRSIVRIIVLLVYQNYIIYLAIGTVSVLFNNLVASRTAEKEYPYIKHIKGKISSDIDIRKKIVENMKSVFIYKASGTLFTATDNVIISKVISTATVGLYSNYLMLSSKLLLIEQIIFTSMTASIGNVIAKENSKKRYEVFQALQSASFIFCGIITGLFCVMANDVIYVWLGEKYQLSELVVIAITGNAYLSCVLLPLWIYRDATGLYLRTKYLMLLGAIENIVLSIILGHVIGLAGVIFASAIARLTSYCWYEPKLLFEEYFDRSPKYYFLGIIKHISLIAAVIFVLKTAWRFYPVTGVLSLLVKGISTGIICCVIFFVAYIRTEGAKTIINKVNQVVGKVRASRQR